jgi:hypothetical protein
MQGLRFLSATIIVLMASPSIVFAASPRAAGKMVDLDGHKLHVNCTGKGNPTVVIENGLGDFSFDWNLVQTKVESFTRVCTYDRAGYAWSDPGPKRTFAQLNLELHDALTKLGEHGPFVLVGHSYGGPVARNFALTYPKDVAGLVIHPGHNMNLEAPEAITNAIREMVDALRGHGSLQTCHHPVSGGASLNECL